MAIDEKIITTETLSHFKTKQDLENERKFKSKNDSTDLKGAVRYDTAQVLTEQEKAQVKANLGITDGGSSGETVEGAVRYDVQQALDEDDKARARENIGAGTGTWADMPDKPFGEMGGFGAIEWDTKPTDTYVPIGDADTGYYKVSSTVPTKDELIGANLKAEFDGEHIDTVLSDSDITDYSEHCYGYASTPYFFVTTQATEVKFTEEVSGQFPCAGVWFISSMGVTWTYYLGKGEIKKIDKKFLPEGLVTTDENGLIPASKLPSYVDDIVEGYHNEEDSLFYEEAEFTTAITGETGKIYVDVASGNTYRWSGSTYVRLNPDKYTLATTSDIDALFT